MLNCRGHNSWAGLNFWEQRLCITHFLFFVFPLPTTDPRCSINNGKSAALQLQFTKVLLIERLTPSHWIKFPIRRCVLSITVFQRSQRSSIVKAEAIKLSRQPGIQQGLAGQQYWNCFIVNYVLLKKALHCDLCKVLCPGPPFSWECSMFYEPQEGIYLPKRTPRG